MMGDFVEFVTRPKHKKQLDEITTHSLVFYVKGEHNAAIGLSENIEDRCQLWILLGKDQCSIYENGECVCSAFTPNILSEQEYRKFWISWYGNNFKFGRNKDGKPILSREIGKRDLKYIDFFNSQTLHEANNDLFWKCLMPQPIKDIHLKKFNEGKAQWVKAEDQLPDNAAIGGFQNEPLYIVRAPHRGSLTPGKFVPSEGIAYIPWGGAANPKAGENFEVLCGYNFIWTKTSGDEIPLGAVEGGHSEVHNECLYVGRIEHEGHIIPGKVQPSHRVCYFAYEGREIARREYEILVLPHP